MKARRASVRNGALVFVVTLLALLAVAELLSRTVLGLGTPPLYEADDAFEYRLKPNQDLRRFGNRIQVNRWGMRAVDFESKKANPQELRVMVFGDSVVNGGSQIDRAELSTSLLQSALQAQLVRPVTVGNISAGSWGPGNWLAYAQRLGFFDADVVVLVVGSGDHADNPVFAPLGPHQPSEPPTLALEEAVQRYLPRYLPEALSQLLEQPPAAPTASREAGPKASARGLADIKEFLQLAQGNGRRVFVVHHPDRDEFMSGPYMNGHAQIRNLVENLLLPFSEMRTPYLVAGPGVYRDNVHHSEQGQAVMAKALLATVQPALSPDFESQVATTVQTERP